MTRLISHEDVAMTTKHGETNINENNIKPQAYYKGRTSHSLNHIIQYCIVDSNIAFDYTAIVYKLSGLLFFLVPSLSRRHLNQITKYTLYNYMNFDMIGVGWVVKNKMIRVTFL